LASNEPRSGCAFDHQAFRGIDLLNQLDLAALKDPVQLLDIGLLEAELGCGARNLGVSEHSDLKPARDQIPDVFQLLEIRS
jgi:hypothetical protein